MGVGFPWSDQKIVRLDAIRDKQPWKSQGHRSTKLCRTLLLWEVAMLYYEFICHACHETFSKILALVDNEEGGTVCLHCGSHNVEQRWSAFSAITSKKSA
jgi:putative FmdB family regulatory protein